MPASGSQPGSAVVTAMLCAGVVTAQFIAGKATRDALYLAHLDVTSLPAMIVATSLLSIGLVVASAKVLRRLSPAAFVPAAFIVSALLFLLEWVLVDTAPKATAAVVYLQISGLGPMLGSGFWLIASERFDPRTAKRRFGQIAGVGTLGGLIGGVFAERIAATAGLEAMLPVLAGLNVVCAWQVRRLGANLIAVNRARAAEVTPDLAAELPRSGLRVLANAPYLRQLAALVLLGTLGASLVDYVFKAEAVASLGQGEGLLRFFALFYAATGVLTFLVQTSSSRLVLERLGLAAAAGSPSVALLAGGLGGLVAPGLGAVTVARASESVFRGSLFRSGYELFYTPIPAAEKRAAKSLIDVGVDRLGDAVGAGVVQIVLMAAPMWWSPAILSIAVGASVLALIVSSRLNRAYVHSLERSLINRAVELDLSEVEDLTSRTVMLRTLRADAATRKGTQAAKTAAAAVAQSNNVDPELRDLLALRSRDRDRIVAVLRNEEGIPAPLVAHTIPLLAWDPVVPDVIRALRKVAEERVGELIDALIDPNQPFAVRRRLARVFSVCVSQRAADGLLLGLDDLRFEVRFQCGRSLAAILEKNPRVRIDKTLIYDVVQREVTVGRPVWQSHRLLDSLDDFDQRSSVDAFVRDRTNQGLAHVFTLLSLVLPAEPLLIAYRGLQTKDPVLRGTSLEYLESVLLPAIRERLWPFLEDPRPAKRVSRAREEIVADLVRAHPTILLNLKELRQSSKPDSPDSAEGQGGSSATSLDSLSPQRWQAN